MNIRKLCLLGLLGVSGIALSGCASTYSFASGEIDPADFGEANRQTFGAMVVNPAPQYDKPLKGSAAAAAAAAERVRTRTVEQPVRQSTTSVQGGGGGGGN